MHPEHKSLRIGTIAISCAILLRLLSGNLPGSIMQTLTSPDTAALFLYLETGRVVRSVPPVDAVQTTPPTAATEESTNISETVPSPQAVFAPEDALCVTVNSACDYSVDIESLLLQNLSWELIGQEPTVLILHSHGSESYSKTEDYLETSAYRTTDSRYNVVSVGAYLTQLLEAKGIRVIHDTTLHDYPSYNSAYQSSREAISQYLQQYPSIQLVLDLHRDAIETSSGEQTAKTITVNGEKVAQLMLVVGTDAGGLVHPNWSENMALAVKLHAQLEKILSGVCRPISFRRQRFNQDLSAGALLIEVGSAGNTRQEALLACQVLAQGIAELASGSITENSTS